MPTREGVDVSHYQNGAGGGGASAIKWARVRNAGVTFAFIKISDKTVKDAFAVRNVSDAREAGLLVGGYHFLRNTAAGVDQAQAFLQTVPFGSGDLIPSLDIELIPATPAARKAYVQKARDWVAAVRNAHGGRWPFLYTRANIWQALGNPTGFGNCPLWLARYGSNPPPIPQGFTSYLIWQYSQSGTVDGITGNVDENHLAISFADFRARYSL
ncbi:hypothetical protein FJ548_14225 [Mesorhizobium sp. B2-4-17]|nr:hypothetical protein FJ548_14225 [Mesorhizobium sp. B2-4-17]